MWKLFELIKASSIIIRQFMLPNPFGEIQNAEVFNWIAGVALYPLTYIIVGVFYKSKSNPALGSFLYLLFYSINTGLIALAGRFDFSKISIIVIGILYFVGLGIIKGIQIKIEWGYN